MSRATFQRIARLVMIACAAILFYLGGWRTTPVALLLVSASGFDDALDDELAVKAAALRRAIDAAHAWRHSKDEHPTTGGT